jgi:cytidyltransferase-like protein
MSGEIRYGIVLGRFQPFHLGHLEYVEAAKKRCERLFIGITNPDPGDRIESPVDVRRSKEENNPFTYIERLSMIEDSLVGIGWGREDFCIVPAPILEPVRLVHYLPGVDESIFLHTVYDEWGELKGGLLADLGFSVEVLWRRGHDERLTSGSAIRELINQGASWEHLVPVEVVCHVTRSKRRVGGHGA